MFISSKTTTSSSLLPLWSSGGSPPRSTLSTRSASLSASTCSGLLVAMILYRTCFSSALVAITSSSHSRTLLTCQRASTHSSRLKLQCSEHELEMVMDPLDLRLYFENLT
ncbi:hypothetical protein GYH30_024907 [Glycine max]|nr:hypothetical protein GYH30_024907 [Glycine max]